MKIIAVDFDGTLCENKFPDIGAPKTEVICALKREKEQGAHVILWTCRDGDMLEAAVSWCASQGLIFDAVNENSPVTKSWLKVDSRKIFAHEYWDDRAVKIT